MTPAIVRTLLFPLLIVTAGCHTFQPASYDQIAPGERVRARVTGEWADSLDTVLLSDSRVVEGTVIEKPGGSSVLMEVSVQNELRGIRFQTLSQRVVIPREGFLEMEIKELDRGRTIGVLALAGVVVGAVLVQQLSKDSGGGGLPGGGGPVEARIGRPLFQIPIP